MLDARGKLASNGSFSAPPNPSNPMGHFNGLSDDDAELLIGGATVPGKAYNGSSYGDFKDGGGTAPNPGNYYNGGNYGKAKKG